MKALKVALVVSCLICVAVPAIAASLSHSPASASVSVPAGSAANVSMTVSIAGVERGTYYLWFVDTVEGTLPASWITSTKKAAFLSNYSNSATTDLSITVPNGTGPGIYSSYVISKAMGPHGNAEPGSGILIQVSVSSGCSGVPEIVISGFSPEVIWPPDHSMDVVHVSGNIVMPEGCTLLATGYSIEDEYGVYTRVGEFVLSGNGEFNVSLPVEAWRIGQDKDGRHYTITLFAEDDVGIGTSDVLKAVVPHDKGKRPNAE